MRSLRLAARTLAREWRSGELGVLLLAAGELARIVAGTPCEPHVREGLAGGAARITAASQLERQHHVLERSECGQKMK